MTGDIIPLHALRATSPERPATISTNSVSRAQGAVLDNGVADGGLQLVLFDWLEEISERMDG